MYSLKHFLSIGPILMLFLLFSNNVSAQNAADYTKWNPYLVKIASKQDFNWVVEFLGKKLPDTKYLGQLPGETTYGVLINPKEEFPLSRKIKATFPEDNVTKITFDEMRKLFPKETRLLEMGIKKE